MSEDHSWIYIKLRNDGCANYDFLFGVKRFLKTGRTHAPELGMTEFRCPCNKCRNVYFRNKTEVENHLCQNGFVRGYQIWVCHGEKNVEEATMRVEQSGHSAFTESNEYLNMVTDGMNWDSGQTSG
ncbi:hypothetical protein LIER_43326 [Lithospermum erythrorhizon]|uniref:Transposase-associated domain-containing protein n=1 Tax=Lithospermum erythrorhizon TaxID=34254 RepID=A0AAV3PWX1_LITER